MTDTKWEGWEIGAALGAVQARIEAACRRAGRSPQDVRLIAVSKTVPLERIQHGRAAGLRDFGENRAAELAAKAPRVDATWHFLGKLQTGSVRHVADHAHVVHSAEPGTALQALSRRAGRRGRRLDCLIEVDFTGRRQGVAPEQLTAAVAAFRDLGALELVGLMTIAPLTDEPEGARVSFARLREMRDALRRTYPGLRELSMGMSADYEVAVDEGATMVRVGTALFGPRRPGVRDAEHLEPAG